MTLAPELIRAITAHGPLTCAAYMERCNAYYYATRDPLGAAGDFTTAPEISQIFGELLGAWLADAWRKNGWEKAVLCEPGPGRGTLMKDALRATRTIAGFHDALNIRLVETSPVLRAIQQSMLKDAHPRMQWHDTLNNLPPLPLLLIANEFFDALPVEQYVKAGLEETERRIGHNGSRFCWEPDAKVVREASPASLACMAQIAGHIRQHGGAALVIDYGYDGAPSGDTLQAVRKHQFTDPFMHPGEADLTAHVDFAALARAARNVGARVHGPVEQGTFLKRLGAELRAAALCKGAKQTQQETILSGLERLVAPHQMGELFKVMAITSAVDTPAGF